MLASRKLASTAIWTREGAALGYPGAKIYLKEDDVLTLFPLVEAMLMPPIHRTQTATWASMNTVHLGSKLAVSVDTGDVGHGEFGQHSLECSARNSGNIGLRTYRAQ